MEVFEILFVRRNMNIGQINQKKITIINATTNISVFNAVTTKYVYCWSSV